MFSSKNLTTGLLVWTAALVAVYAGISFVVLPAVYPDSAWGLITLKGMQSGAAFNHRIFPNPNDISVDVFYGNSWWSPGQYLLPWLVTLLLGCSMGHAFWLTALVMSVSGLAGYYRLIRKLGFSSLIAAAAIAVISGMRYFSLGFSVFHGGDILLFGSLPWIIIAALRLRELRWKMLPFLLILFWAGVFCKLSFSVYALSLLLALLLLYPEKKQGLRARENLPFYFRLAVFSILFFTGVKIFFLSYGHTIPETMEAFRFDPVPVVSAVAFSFSSSMSFMDIAKAVYTFIEGSMVTEWNRVLPVITVAACFSIASIYFICRSHLARTYKILLASFYGVVISVMLFFYLTKAQIGLDERHFRPTGLLLLPALLFYLNETPKRVLRFAGITFLVLQVVYGLLSFAVFTRELKRDSFAGSLGFLHRFINAEELEQLRRVDASLPEDRNNLIFVPDPSLALEISRNRVLPANVNLLSLKKLELKTFHGKVDNLVIVLRDEFIGGPKEKLVLQSFTGYNPDLWQYFRKGRYYFIVQDAEALQAMKAAGLEKDASMS